MKRSPVNFGALLLLVVVVVIGILVGLLAGKLIDRQVYSGEAYVLSENRLKRVGTYRDSIEVITLTGDPGQMGTRSRTNGDTALRTRADRPSIPI